MCNTVFEMEYFPERHTRTNIKERIDAIVEKIDATPSETSIVTDSGANMLKGVEDMMSYPCSCHKLSTTIEKGWIKALEDCNELKVMNDSANKLITAINNKSNIQQKLIVKIQNSSQTRAWRGLYKKFNQIRINYDSLCELSRTERALLPGKLYHLFFYFFKLYQLIFHCSLRL